MTANPSWTSVNQATNGERGPGGVQVRGCPGLVIPAVP
jgi:hypothetical protein